MHTTIVPENAAFHQSDCPVTALCLTGKPGAGCTTIGEYCEDIGIPKLPIDNDEVPEQAHTTYPHCVWIDDVTAETDVEALVETTDGLTDALIIRITAPEVHRKKRQFERDVASLHESGSPGANEINAVWETIREREQTTTVHSDYHVCIENGPKVGPTKQIVRLDELTTILAPDCDCPQLQ